MSFQKRLSSGEFVVLAEVDTPKGVDISQLIINARRIKGRVDAVVVPDMADGMMRMTALAGGVLMQQQGLEAIIQIYGRDRNRMAIQADLLGAYVLGIQNVLVVKGEEMAYGDHRDAKPVDDLDEIGILGAISSLCEGVDLAGIELKGSPEFVCGCTIAAYADDKALKTELDLARKKVEAGASFLITPPVFDLDYFLTLKKETEGLGAPLIPTVFLLKSVGVARYMATNEPGIFIPEDLIRRMRRSPDRETEGLRIAGEMIAELRKVAAGVQIVTLGWEHQLPTILDYAGI